MQRLVLNGTQFASTDKEEADLVMSECLDCIIKHRIASQQSHGSVAVARTLRRDAEQFQAPAESADVADPAGAADSAGAAADHTSERAGASTPPPPAVSNAPPTVNTTHRQSKRKGKQGKKAGSNAGVSFMADPVTPPATPTAAPAGPHATPPANTSSSASSSTSSTAGGADYNSSNISQAERDEVIRKCLLMLDGELNQIRVVLEDGAGLRAKNANILLMKLAAACSKTTQANDVMRAFLILHSYFSSESFYSLDMESIALPDYYDFVEELLAPIPAASRSTYLRYFAVLPHGLSNAFTSNNIVTGYTKSGTGAPPNPRRILTNCPSIVANLTPAEVDTLVQRAYEVAQAAILDGYVGSQSDAYLEEKFGDLLGPVQNMGKDSKSKVVNQWRATLLTDDTTTSELKSRAEMADAEKRAAAEKKAALEAAQAAQAVIKENGGKVTTCDMKPINGCKAVIDESALLSGTTNWWRCTHNKRCKRTFCRDCSVLFAAMHAGSH